MIVFHVDVNSAYLSWEAARRLREGLATSETDLRNIPSVIGGDQSKRHGVVLAKSESAKKLGIRTGESLFEAYKKCPDLTVIPPDHNLYEECSEQMYRLLLEYTPLVERFSVDECFMDYTSSEGIFGDPIKLAYKIKNRIYEEFGFTVNIGISNTKILAKMASDFQKPNRVHTLFPNEIEEKLWPLPISELFMVGRVTTAKLKRININTIGDIARVDPEYLKRILKSQGQIVWNYANGIDDSEVKPPQFGSNKGIGNSLTISEDIASKEAALQVLLMLTENVCSKLREQNKTCSLISVNMKTDEFIEYSHQRVLKNYLSSTSEIYKIVKELFNEGWKGEPVRLLGVRVSDFGEEEQKQISIEDYINKNNEKNESDLDKAIDSIRKKYGEEAIKRSSLVKAKRRQE